MIVMIVLVNVLVASASAQVDAKQTEPDRGHDDKQNTEKDVAEGSRRNYVKSLVEDQTRLWSTPFRLKPRHIPWVAGVATTTWLLVAADPSIERRFNDTNFQSSRRASDLGVAMLAGTAGTLYLTGTIRDNEHARETGALMGEAAINTFAVSSVMKAAFRRSRPGEPNAGKFWSGGDSFPSDHAAISWAMASVMVHEYPGWGTKLLSYGLASAVSATRVTGQKHFPSDVLVGSGIGWLIGDQIYRRRHSADLPGVSYGTFTSHVERVPNPMHKGSPYVPLDSWVYPVLLRLSALGKVPPGTQGLRPWTRLECARMVKESMVADDDGELGLEIRDLEREFARELDVLEGASNLRGGVESVYTRFTGISGAPLTDALHFGQTLTNDYGRPNREGFNSVTGVTADAEIGPITVYTRGEFQHSPAAPAQSDQVRRATASADGLPVAPGFAMNDVNRFRLLDAYAAMNVKGWQAAFGKQSLWWGPNYGGDLMFSNSAEPIYAASIVRTAPLRLPSLLGFMGDIRPAFFLGQLQGYRFLRLGPDFDLTGSYDHLINPQPYIWGGKLSLQPTPNLELGISMTTVFSGRGRPMTLSTFLHTFSTRGNAQELEPGDRRTGFDFSYRIPGLRKWLVLYNGSMSEDEPSPVAYPRRSAMNPGIYIPQIPGMRKLDFRAEGVYTNLPNDPRTRVFYTNAHYANGYTNYGEILGSWIGPQSSGLQAWTTYWWSAKRKLQLGYRGQWTDRMNTGGGSLKDFSARCDFPISKTITATTWAQYERWIYPSLAPTARSNLVLSVQLTYKPFQGNRSRQD